MKPELAAMLTEVLADIQSWPEAKLTPAMRKKRRKLQEDAPKTALERLLGEPVV